MTDKQEVTILLAIWSAATLASTGDKWATVVCGVITFCYMVMFAFVASF